MLFSLMLVTTFLTLIFQKFVSFTKLEEPNFPIYMYDSRNLAKTTYQSIYRYNSLFMNVGQVIDGPQNGPAPPPWSIPAQPNQIFTPQAVNIEVPHTASVKVKTPCYISGHLYFG